MIWQKKIAMSHFSKALIAVKNTMTQWEEKKKVRLNFEFSVSKIFRQPLDFVQTSFLTSTLCESLPRQKFLYNVVVCFWASCRMSSGFLKQLREISTLSGKNLEKQL